MEVQRQFDVTIIGAGIAGIATAYYLSRTKNIQPCLIDGLQPLSYTSAQSGDNYRNWWPHSVMTRFMNHSIDLLEEIAEATGNRINMKYGGYLLATRNPNIDHFLDAMQNANVAGDKSPLRFHSGKVERYRASLGKSATGVDILSKPTIIKALFPHFDQQVKNIIHIRRAGAISGQQLGQCMLESIRERGGLFIHGQVTGIEANRGYQIRLESGPDIRTERLVLAAGPFTNQLLSQLNIRLPVINVLQQKLAFVDQYQAVPRDQPFAVDLDPQRLDWTDEERAMIDADGHYRWLADDLPGGVHCRPEGGVGGQWVKLGWAFNTSHSEPDWNPALDDFFPEIVLRGAARLNPALKQYYARLPARRSHYGGYYSMTEENWPIIGPLGTDGVFAVGALSGFGTMGACAAGSLCAKWITGEDLPDYARALSVQRYQNQSLMAELRALNEKGSL